MAIAIGGNLLIKAGQYMSAPDQYAGVRRHYQYVSSESG